MDKTFQVITVHDINGEKTEIRKTKRSNYLTVWNKSQFEFSSLLNKIR